MKKNGFSILFFLTMILLLAGHPVKVPAADAEFTDNKNGTVTMTYKNNEKAKVKLVIQKDKGKQYKYDIPKGELADCGRHP